MIKNLSLDERFDLIRPLPDSYYVDSNGIPVIKKQDVSLLDWDMLQGVSIGHVKAGRNNRNSVALAFCYDNVLERYWRNTRKYAPMLSTCAIVATPDFSVAPSMNVNVIRYNTYRNRWIGCTWQSLGSVVLPTIGWTIPENFDIEFSGVEYGCPVVISTIGCLNNRDVFLAGFNEMKRRINPSVIVVVGSFIEGITGTIVHFPYEDTLSSNYEQLHLGINSRLFTVEERG